MKKGFILIAFALLTLTTFIAKHASAGEDATNCSYTGNYNDYCFASDGGSNVVVVGCTPGSTTCYY